MRRIPTVPHPATGVKVGKKILARGGEPVTFHRTWMSGPTRPSNPANHSPRGNKGRKPKKRCCLIPARLEAE